MTSLIVSKHSIQTEWFLGKTLGFNKEDFVGQMVLFVRDFYPFCAWTSTEAFYVPSGEYKGSAVSVSNPPVETPAIVTNLYECPKSKHPNLVALEIIHENKAMWVKGETLYRVIMP